MERRTRVLVLCLALAAGCARPAPRVAYGMLTPGLAPFLAAHPLAADENLRADEVGRTAGASYHLVQVRGSERPHRHATHDVAVVLLHGHGALVLGAETVTLAEGDVVVIPRDVPHWFSNRGRAPAVAFAIFTPPLDAPDSVPANGR